MLAKRQGTTKKKKTTQDCVLIIRKKNWAKNQFYTSTWTSGQLRNDIKNVYKSILCLFIKIRKKKSYNPILYTRSQKFPDEAPIL